MILESDSGDYNVWSIGSSADVSSTEAPAALANVTTIKMCQNADSSGYTALSITTEDADGVVTEGTYMPAGVTVDETATSCETVQSTCFKSLEFFATDDKIVGLELIDIDDSVS